MSITPADVLKYNSATKGFLCPLSANQYGIDFLAFKIRDVDSGEIVFEVAKDPNAGAVQYPEDFDYDDLRRISYEFPGRFLTFKTVGTMLRFKVGDRPLKNFRMIERHYFDDRLVKSFDFNFQFCIPNSTNEWEAIYDMPDLADDEVEDMLKSSKGTSSDSFYFVDGKLVMHNKAHYKYADEKEEQKN